MEAASFSSVSSEDREGSTGSLEPLLEATAPSFVRRIISACSFNARVLRLRGARGLNTVAILIDLSLRSEGLEFDESTKQTNKTVLTQSVPERGQDCLLYRVLQGVERHPMEPHRAPLGGEGHSTEAHESFHGDDTWM